MFPICKCFLYHMRFLVFLSAEISETPYFPFIRYTGAILQRGSRPSLSSAFDFRMDNPAILYTSSILRLHWVLYRRPIRFEVRPDVLLNSEHQRSGIGAERVILIPRNYTETKKPSRARIHSTNEKFFLLTVWQLNTL